MTYVNLATQHDEPPLSNLPSTIVINQGFKALGAFVQRKLLLVYEGVGSLALPRRATPLHVDNDEPRGVTSLVATARHSGPRMVQLSMGTMLLLLTIVIKDAAEQRLPVPVVPLCCLVALVFVAHRFERLRDVV